MHVQRLKEMDINIIEDSGDGKDFSGIKSEDVVILPAFGASVQEMKMLSEMGVQLVDTTCPWVAKVCACYHL
jgi:4-hydroxy-3-methylbut-2-enyl diphosphate reductase